MDSKLLLHVSMYGDIKDEQIILYYLVGSYSKYLPT